MRPAGAAVLEADAVLALPRRSAMTLIATRDRKSMKAELKEAVLATGSRLMDIDGIGPAGAGRILADVGDIARFPDAAISRPGGTAPIDASPDPPSGPA
jgi:transposase